MNEKHMGAWEAYRRYWKNGVNFQGRARRKEYWMPVLINGLMNTAIVLVMVLLFSTGAATGDSWNGLFSAGIFLYVSLFVFSLANMLPSLAVTVRRFHDIGKSGWWVLVPYILPMVVLFISMMVNLIVIANSSDINDGSVAFTIIPAIAMLISIGVSIWIIVLLAKDSKPETNQWGMNPKDPNSPDIPMNIYNDNYQSRNVNE